MSTSTGTVMVLNALYEPTRRVDVPTAMRLLLRKVAEVIEADATRSIGPYPWPKVLRMIRYVAPTWWNKPAKWHRGGVYIRDRHRCAYCGGKARTLDHVFPASRGGDWTWLNIVAACQGCNEAKGNRTPDEAGMPLRYAKPYVPTVGEIVGKSRKYAAA